MTEASEIVNHCRAIIDQARFLFGVHSFLADRPFLRYVERRLEEARKEKKADMYDAIKVNDITSSLSRVPQEIRDLAPAVRHVFETYPSPEIFVTQADMWRAKDICRNHHLREYQIYALWAIWNAWAAHEQLLSSKCEGHGERLVTMADALLGKSYRLLGEAYELLNARPAILAARRREIGSLKGGKKAKTKEGIRLLVLDILTKPKTNNCSPTAAWKIIKKKYPEVLESGEEASHYIAGDYEVFMSVSHGEESLVQVKTTDKKEGAAKSIAFATFRTEYFQPIKKLLRNK